MQKYFRALHCPTRWHIIDVIGRDEKTTGEILEALREREVGLARSSIYYHLSALADADIITVSGYREEGGGAPEKVWRLETTEIKIDLLEDLGKTAEGS
ncbi:MAG: ArsR/SmtB family transcription factor [Candidatus Bathyarchaeia archaeon]